MSSIKTISKIKVYEINDEDVSFDDKTIEVSNHWNRKSLCVIKVDGKKYTVEIDHLERALKNAYNAHSF